MKEVALVGTTCHVFSDVLSLLLERDIAVVAFVDNPEKVMLNDELLTVSHLYPADEGAVEQSLQGFHDAVLVYDDNLMDVSHNTLTLESFVPTLTGARKAGVNRVIVVGGPDSEAFFVTELKRIDDIDWVFVSTEGDFATRVANEVLEPSYHREVYHD
ncbi:MAG: NAD(P)H-binding protein [Muribaculaceae bacterium]|nr:NAD(P)H-binding protein [Muribaculaceae bacterium]MDE6332225.1 NAD(P)H-binding protein [Muribaculaceae bacterium]